MLLRLTFLLCSASVPAFATPAEAGAALALHQEPDDERSQVQEHLARARNTRLPLRDRESSMEELLALGSAGPRALAGALQRELARSVKQWQGDRARFLAAFGKAADGVMKRRLDRRVSARIDELRSIVIRGARDSNLSKERIQSESDPALAELEEWLTVTMHHVWEVDEDLFEDYSELLERAEELSALGAYWTRSREALRAAGEEKAAERLKAPPEVAGGSEALLGAVRDRAQEATPWSAQDRKVLARNAELAAELDPEEAAGIADLNRIRLLLDLGAQRIDLKLCDACRDHSKDMQEKKFFSHDSPIPGKETPWKRAALAGTSAGAENIAMGARKGPGAIRQWWYSPGHHRNMLGGGARTGLGRHGVHWTQLFGG